MTDYFARARALHREMAGKIDYAPKHPIGNQDDLSLLYTPGVADPCRCIASDPNEAYELTGKGNLVAVVTDGSAVLGLGNIGSLAGLPVMEGKAVLFKEFGGVDAVPVCLDTQDADRIVDVVSAIAPGFGGINLEDISAPRCFDIERRLKSGLDIPVFHDDQHGTAIVTLAGLINALMLVEKEIDAVRLVVNGAGSAGLAIARMLHGWGAQDILVCDSRGILMPDDPVLSPEKRAVAELVNPQGEFGSMHDAVEGADVFIGVSAPDVLSAEDVKRMASDPIIFAMANPIPEIDPELATAAGARVVATGRSDYPNQVNNVLAFPGLFRGSLDVRTSAITEEMTRAAARAIAGLVPDDQRESGLVIPSPLDRSVARAVALEVARTAVAEGVARYSFSDQEIQRRIDRRLPPPD